jgi:hypothetical protein
MTECIQAQLDFSFHRNRRIVAHFDGGQISSDAGLLPLRQFDVRHHLTRGWAAARTDARLPQRQHHTSQALFTQRLYQIVAGYEDANDAALLRHDPIFQLLADAAPGQPLSSQPTLSRWENAFTGRDWVAMNRGLLESFAKLCAARVKAAGEIVLDVDSTADPTYGQQEFSFYNGCYECSVYHPLWCLNAVPDICWRPICAAVKSAVRGARSRCCGAWCVSCGGIFRACRFAWSATRASRSPRCTCFVKKTTCNIPWESPATVRSGRAESAC